VTLTVALTVLGDHVATLKGALAKAELAAERAGQERDAANERARLAEAEAATVPALRETIEALKTALARSEDRAAQIRAERDRLLTREHLREQRRWWRRLTG